MLNFMKFTFLIDNLLSYSKTLLISLLVLLLFSNAITIRRDKSILFSIIVISSLILTLTQELPLTILIVFICIVLELLPFFPLIKRYLLYINNLYYKFKCLLTLFNYLYKDLSNYLCIFYLLTLVYVILVNSFWTTAIFVMLTSSFWVLIYLLFLDTYLCKYNFKLHKTLTLIFLLIFILSLFILLSLISISLIKFVYNIVFIKNNQKTHNSKIYNNNYNSNNNSNNKNNKNDKGDGIGNKSDTDNKKKKPLTRSEISARYRNSENGKKKIAKYEKTEERIADNRARSLKYDRSEKGKANRKEYLMKKKLLKEDNKFSSELTKLLQETYRYVN
uniref:Uncharacterized protein n=1 Tax=Pseudocercospora fijiensis TaxID=1873960 RepID=A0A516EZP2_9PEZI|nr:hypothetical protein [Pseudocercospora fijiensis]QDO71975.1 hypothetical protein [Pseudocercospora fijiensis]